MGEAEHIAVHEAGHAVMQWFTGGEAELLWIQFFRESDATILKGDTYIRRPTSYPDIATVRSRLLVLWAGNVASEILLGSPVDDCWSDVESMCHALLFHFGGNVEPKPHSPVPYRLTDSKLDDEFQGARRKAVEILSIPKIHSAVVSVSDLVLAIPPRPGELLKVDRADLLSACEIACGQDFRDGYDLRSWLDG